MVNTLVVNEAESHWEAVVGYMQRDPLHSLNPAAFSSWIAPLKPYKINDGNFILKAKSDHVKTTVNTRYAGKIAGVFRAVYGKEYNIKVILEDEDINVESSSQVRAANLVGANLRPKFHFETFVQGKCNQFAYAASLAVAEELGTRYNPLFIYGDVGLGKTHLMQSIGNQALFNNPDCAVLYTTSENLTNEFVYAIRHKKNQEFRDKYRKVDVLLVDDIQFLSDKEGTQEEFFHTFNALYNDNKQIVLTSDKPPSELKSIEDRLRSRFGSGLTVDITSPDLETRMAILWKKAESERIEIDPAVISYIARYIHSNIRELEGALNVVTAQANLMGSKCTVEFAEKSLEHMLKQKERREVDVAYIQEVVAGYFSVSTDDLVGKKRTAEITYARHIAMYLARMIIDTPLKTIGKEFGGKDHTTVIHAVDKITTNIDKNKNLKKEIAELEKKIKAE